MKVKILDSKLNSYWYSNSIGEEFDVIYVIKDRDNTYRQTDKPRYIRNVDVVITELPESFCVKRCDDKEKWNKYLNWLNKTYKWSFNGLIWKYYGYSNECGPFGVDKLLGTEIHIDDVIKHIDYMESQLTVKMDKEFNLTTNEGRLAYAKKYYPIGTEYFPLTDKGTNFSVPLTIDFEPRITNIYGDIKGNGNGLIYTNGRWAEIVKEETIMEKQKLSRQGLKEIHSVACSAWKQTLEQYGSRNPLEDYIELTQEEVIQMFDACEYNQLPIVSKYLKQDDGSVDLSKVKFDKSGILINDEYILRINDIGGDDKSFLLISDYDWSIKIVENKQRLYPTKKK